jgi:hypothetical protein
MLAQGGRFCQPYFSWDKVFEKSSFALPDTCTERRYGVAKSGKDFPFRRLGFPGTARQGRCGNPSQQRIEFSDPLFGEGFRKRKTFLCLPNKVRGLTAML